MRSSLQHPIELRTARVDWLLVLIFSMTLFAKSVLFHYAVYQSVLISSIIFAPLSFFKFYVAKLLLPLFLSSFILITRTRWWTILVSILVDVWCIANLVYFKTYDSFLNINDILMVGNMAGAWSSVLAYLDWTMLLMLFITLLWGGVLLFFRANNGRKNYSSFFLLGLSLYALAILNNYLIYSPSMWSASADGICDISDDIGADEQEAAVWTSFQKQFGSMSQLMSAQQIQPNKYLLYFPFYTTYYSAISEKYSAKARFMRRYISDQSILSDFVAVLVYYVFCKEYHGEKIQLSKDDLNQIEANLFVETSSSAHQNLILILVESLESWPLLDDVEGVSVTPRMRSLIQGKGVLYCDKIKNQTLAGNSGDGQMIVNTGLLPIQGGVACMEYGENTFPNIAHFYKQAIFVNPWPQIWNQDEMSRRYSYSKCIEPEDGQWEDNIVFDTLLFHIRDAESPFFSLALTVSTHAPFNRIKDNAFSTTAPDILDRYLHCLHYTDSCLGEFIDAVMSDSVLATSTIVITGDHTVFKPAMLLEFMEYSQKQGLSISNGTNYCPLIVISPLIKENIAVSEVCYQMDIFPTILNLIGCEGYYWHGLGVNLLDESARQCRSVEEHKAYEISEKMIRSDYFKNYYIASNVTADKK